MSLLSPIDRVTLLTLVAQVIVDVFLWIQVLRTSGETRRRLLLMASALLVIFLASGISVAPERPTPLATLIAVIAAAGVGIVDVFLWIRWFRTAEQTRWRLLGSALVFLVLFLGSGATVLTTILG